MDAKALKEYRVKLYTDLYTNIIPDRVPITDTFTVEFFIENAGLDLLTSQYCYTDEMIDEIYAKVMEFAQGDTVSLGAARNAVGMMFSKSRNNVMGKTGMIQHPEVCNMKEDEYDEYIKNPHEFTQQVINPRANAGWDADPILYCMNFAKYMLCSMDSSKMFAAGNARAAEKYGLYSAPGGVTGRQPVPFDTLADMNRGFSSIVKDIKRKPEKVIEALEALMPYCIWAGSKSKAHPLGTNTVMTHMAAFLRTSEFDKYYWPTFEKLVNIAAARGQQTTLFCEHDWTRFVDQLSELPQGTRIFMEYGDPKKFKDVLGKRLVLGGFYPVSLFKTSTKQQCLDKAKELMDVMAPGGNYFFRTDKSMLALSDMNFENYTAVMQYVKDNYKYDNAGQAVSSENKADTIKAVSADEYPAFKSKYIFTFEDFIKDYPVADERALPLMKAQYEKYSRMVDGYFS